MIVTSAITKWGLKTTKEYKVLGVRNHVQNFLVKDDKGQKVWYYIGWFDGWTE